MTAAISVATIAQLRRVLRAGPPARKIVETGPRDVLIHTRDTAEYHKWADFLAADPSGAQVLVKVGVGCWQPRATRRVHRLRTQLGGYTVTVRLVEVVDHDASTGLAVTS
jgi:hypothetical protein